MAVNIKMPPKKTKGSKKKSLDEGDDDLALSQIDVKYNPDIVTGLLKDLAVHVESKCSQIQKETEFMIISLQQAFYLEMIKLPSQVKQMSIKRFKEEFGYSLEAVTRGAITGPAAASISKPSREPRMSQRVFQTPAQKKNVQSLRNPREGERILSENGSPLGEFTTVKKPTKQTSNIIPATPSIKVPLATGEVVDIENADVENMPLEVKQEAIIQMQTAMDNMRLLMEKLQARIV